MISSSINCKFKQKTQTKIRKLFIDTFVFHNLFRIILGEGPGVTLQGKYHCQHLGVHNFVREKKRKLLNVTWLTSRERLFAWLWDFIRFWKDIFSACLTFLVFFPWLHIEGFYKPSVKYKTFKQLLDSLSLILLPKPGCVCSLQSGLILATTSMAEHWFKHQLRVAVGKVAFEGPLTFFFLA